MLFYVAPLGLAFDKESSGLAGVVARFRRVAPYAVLCRPFPTSRDKSRLAFDKEFGSTRISFPKLT